MGACVKCFVDFKVEEVETLSRCDFLPEAFRKELVAILGSENVITDKSEIDCSTVDVWWITRYCMFQGNEFPQVSAVVYPESKESIIAVVNL